MPAGRPLTTPVVRLHKLLTIFSALFLAFVGGAYVADQKVFPYSYLQQAFSGGRALFVQQTQYGDRFHRDVWQKSRFPERGLRRHSAGLAQAGHTLYVSSHAPVANLVDLGGRVLHSWSIPFSNIWEDPPHIGKPRPDGFVFFRKAWVYPNGDLLAVFVAQGDTPWGYGLVKLDKDSRLVWKHASRNHHDLEVSAAGQIYTLSHQVVADMSGVGPANTPYLDDFVEVLSRDGALLQRVSIGQALLNSPFRSLALGNHRVRFSGQLLHTNTIKPVTAEMLKAFPFLAEGQVLVSARDIHALLVVDLQGERVVWAATGAWRGQHDPDLLENGHILIFDNWGGLDVASRSRILEVDPDTSAIVWSYVGTDQDPFYSWQRGSQQRLANGNTLITDSAAGRIFEVSTGGTIVWEFINPVRGGADGALIPYVMWAQRFEPDYFDFLDL